MVQGIDQGIDAVFFIGYHARMGTPNAILDHTWSSARVQNLYLNGRLTGEIGLNASLCGHYHAPVLLISGDKSANKEAAEWIAGMEHVVVKQASSRSSAELLSPAVTQEMICHRRGAGCREFLKGQSTCPQSSRVFRSPWVLNSCIRKWLTKPSCCPAARE